MPTPQEGFSERHLIEDKFGSTKFKATEDVFTGMNDMKNVSAITGGRRRNGLEQSIRDIVPS